VSIKVSERNGAVVGAVQVDENDEIMLISDQGTLVRTRVAEVSTVGRNTQGVTLIRTVEGEHVVALQRIDDIEDAIELDENGEPIVDTDASQGADGISDGANEDPKGESDDGNDDNIQSDDDSPSDD